MSTLLSGLCICATGVSSKEERLIKDITRELGGRYASDYTKSVTHLIVKRVGSKKHQLALIHRIYTLKIQWLLDCKTQQNRLNEDDYRVQPFTGLTICVTQLDIDERQDIMRLVESNGGVFNSFMEEGRSTHLIALRPEGEKYDAARVWKGVRIITPQWARDCADRQVWLNETDYPVLADVEVEQKRRLTAKRQSLIRRTSSAPTARATAPPVVNKSTEELSLLHSALCVDGGEPPAKGFFAQDSTVTYNRGVLQGEVFFISGFSPQVQVLIVQLICIGGGFRHHMLTERVTRVILGSRASDTLRNNVRMHPLHPKPMTLRWLIRTVVRNWSPSCEKSVSEMQQQDSSLQETLKDDIDHVDTNTNDNTSSAITPTEDTTINTSSRDQSNLGVDRDGWKLPLPVTHHRQDSASKLSRWKGGRGRDRGRGLKEGISNEQRLVDQGVNTRKRSRELTQLPESEVVVYDIETPDERYFDW